MPDVSLFDAGPIPTWTDHAVTIPGTDITRRGIQFLSGKLDLRGGEISVNVFAPGQATPLDHCHKVNEEVYLFLSGTGEMLLDGKVVPVKEGTCVRLSPTVARAWRNSGTAPMAFIVVQYPQRDGVPTGTADGERTVQAWPS